MSSGGLATIRIDFGDWLAAELEAAKDRLAAIPEHRTSTAGSPEEEVEAALALLDDIQRTAADPTARTRVLPMIQRLGLRIGLQFVDGIKGKKRRVRRLAGGMMAFGDASLPVGRDKSSFPGQDDHAAKSKQLVDSDCENSLDRPQMEMVPGILVPSGPGRSENRPQEGISFTKDSRGEQCRTSLHIDRSDLEKLAKAV
jgi:hypothetical protein